MNRFTVWNAVLFLSVVTVITPSARRADAADDPKGAARQNKGPRVYKGRVIAPVMTAEGGGAEWLERRDRDETEQPEKVIDALEIAPDSVVADIGAGTGYFSLRIARRLGPEGRVLATDVQPQMLRLLTENMKQARLRNIDRILATANDAKLPTNKVDLALMVDVYHELQDPEKTMAQIRRSLTDDGRLVLVEYRAEDPDVPIKPEHKTTLRQIRYEIEPMGFRLKEVFEFLPHQHIEVFVKDDVQGEEVITDPADFPTIRKPGWAGAGSAEPYDQAGFTKLFNGADLSGWSGDSRFWRVRDESLRARPDATAEDSELQTMESFHDFELDLQWALRNPDGIAGVAFGSNPRLLVRLESGVPYASGYPERIAARRAGEVTTKRDKHPVHMTNDTANAILLAGEWNRLTVRRVAGRVIVAINGVQTAEFESPEGDIRGPVALQAIEDEVEFREVWIKR